MIPGSLWALLDQMVISSKQLEGLASRIELTSLRDVAQLEKRAKLANLSAEVSAFAAGIHQIDRCRTYVMFSCNRIDNDLLSCCNGIKKAKLMMIEDDEGYQSHCLHIPPWPDSCRFYCGNLVEGLRYVVIHTKLHQGLGSPAW